MNENKTKPTISDVFDFLDAVDDEQKRQDSLKLIEMMEAVSGHPAVMWGPSIIGFDSYHYVYDSGREGDMCVIGFSPRKNALVLYLLENLAEQHPDELEKLGKYTTSKGCLYIKRLSDINLDVLRTLIETSYQRTKQQWP